MALENGSQTTLGPDQNANAPQPQATPGYNEKPEVDPAREALVTGWCDKIRYARGKREKTFKEMRESEDFAMTGADKAWGDQYKVPIIPRYINQAVATLYAKNPTTVFKRRKRLKYRLWDGRSDSLQSAMQMAQMGDPDAIAILQEVLTVRQNDTMLDRMGETLQVLWDYFLNEQSANFKQQLKAAVRRVKTAKVAYIELGYQRAMKLPDAQIKINDITEKIAAIETTLNKVQNDELQDENPELEQLKLNLADLQRDQMVVVREGPIFNFPKPDQVIIDLACTHLKSLTGARWLAIEYEFTPDEIFARWQKDVRGYFKAYTPDGKPATADKDSRARVWRVQDKVNQQYFVVCDGYCDFLEEPATPQVWMERFWSIFPIVFNEVEHYEEIYPKSDVEQAMDIQKEYNRSREGLRQHRIAAKPWWVEGRGLTDDEKGKISNRANHAVVSLPSLATGEKIQDILQAGPTAPIDPNLYEVEQHFNDLLRVIGFQEAQIGATSNSTATESSIAQQSQTAAQAENTDDLDEVLTELARAGGQVLLMNMEKQSVIEIAGEGAVWPDMPTTREEAAKEIMLEVEAGSSGRPNQAAELANLERAVPYIMQIPGINPTPLARRYVSLLNMDVEEIVAEGLPSITAMNALVAKAAAGATAAGAAGGQPTGNAQTDPNAQGAQGSQNAPAAQANEPGPQPGYTAPQAAA